MKTMNSTRDGTDREAEGSDGAAVLRAVSLAGAEGPRKENENIGVRTLKCQLSVCVPVTTPIMEDDGSKGSGAGMC